MNKYDLIGLEVVTADGMDLTDDSVKEIREALNRFNAAGPENFNALYNSAAESIEYKLSEFIPGTVMLHTFPSQRIGWSMDPNDPYRHKRKFGWSPK